MKLDENPKGMAMIMLAIGVFGIGIILTLGFFSNTTLLGVGVTMAVVGGAGAILGCIHIGSVSEEKPGAPDTIAPPRIPPPTEIVFRDSVMAPDEDLHYEPCSATPPRVSDRFRSPGSGGVFSGPRGRVVEASWMYSGGGAGTHVVSSPPLWQRQSRDGVAGGSVLPQGRNSVGPLSPYEQRSFPVPASLLPLRGAAPPPSAAVSPEHGGGGATTGLGMERYSAPSPQQLRPLPPAAMSGDPLAFRESASRVSGGPRSASYGFSPATAPRDGSARYTTRHPDDGYHSGDGYDDGSGGYGGGGEGTLLRGRQRWPAAGMWRAGGAPRQLQQPGYSGLNSDTPRGSLQRPSVFTDGRRGTGGGDGDAVDASHRRGAGSRPLSLPPAEGFDYDDRGAVAVEVDADDALPEHYWSPS